MSFNLLFCVFVFPVPLGNKHKEGPAATVTLIRFPESSAIRYGINSDVQQLHRGSVKKITLLASVVQCNTMHKTRS